MFLLEMKWEARDGLDRNFVNVKLIIWRLEMCRMQEGGEMCTQQGAVCT